MALAMPTTLPALSITRAVLFPDAPYAEALAALRGEWGADIVRTAGRIRLLCDLRLTQIFHIRDAELYAAPDGVDAAECKELCELAEYLQFTFALMDRQHAAALRVRAAPPGSGAGMMTCIPADPVLAALLAQAVWPLSFF